MSDLELTKLCAEAMGETVREYKGYLFFYGPTYDNHQHQRYYDPLHDDAQAMALVKRLRLDVDWSRHGIVAVAGSEHNSPYTENRDGDLNRAIVECVAKMQEAHRE